ncbi:hypothetical protein MUK42_12904 [Musa troglodytarum]|uniref:Uncharacterized protein n=1 Tax=Musa troglodytarum TaxID=320322 RepID=A0A9E7GSX0_9LILI|nr:hypothetical protein MUK42_12904 [Musa troglodytarum]
MHIGPKRERFVVRTSASTTRCSRCCSMRQRGSLGTPSLGYSSSPVVSSSSKGCCARCSRMRQSCSSSSKGCCVRWSKIRWSCTSLGATSSKATPLALFWCILDPVHAWKGWLPPSSMAMAVSEEEELVLVKRFYSLSEHAMRLHKRSVVE